MTETSIYDIILSYYTPTSYIQKIKLMKKGEQFTCTLISFKSKRLFLPYQLMIFVGYSVTNFLLGVRNPV
jgi:hypothetical protein